MNAIHCRLPLVVLLSAVTVLTSCLDYREELWINADSSGKIEATITVNRDLSEFDDSPDQMEAELRRLFESTEGTTLDRFQSYDQGKKRTYEITVSFQDLKFFKPTIVSGQGNIGALFGEFEIRKIPDGRLSVQRVVTLTPPEAPETAPEESADATEGNADATASEDDTNSFAKSLGRAVGGLITNSILNDYHLEYVTHFPTEVITANSADVDGETKTVTWRIPLSEASRGPVTMNAEIKRPGRWMTWLFIGVVILVTLAIVIPAIRKPTT